MKIVTLLVILSIIAMGFGLIMPEIVVITLGLASALWILAFPFLVQRKRIRQMKRR